MEEVKGLSEFETSDEDIGVVLEKKTKKRKVTGRLRDVAKRLRVQSHEAGSDCKCRGKCFEVIPLAARDNVIKNFNLLETTNEQNSYLCGLISLVPVQRRRPRVEQANALLKDVTCKYKVRCIVENKVTEFPVCRKAFTAIHGITKKKVEFLINSLKLTGRSPKDQRGKHKNRKHRHNAEVIDSVKAHIDSFNGRGAHYSTKDTSKKYLPEDLSINKMHKLFMEKYPDIKVSYESYRSVFNNDFNISFGYPRTDTCSFCDEHNIKLECLKIELKEIKDDEKKAEAETKVREVEIQLKLHLKKAEKFYQLKAKARKLSKKPGGYTAVCMDFGKNLCVPNITSNDAYYKRQLSVFCFNIHNLGKNDSLFYLYPESEGKKGSANVCDLLFHFVNNYLSEQVEHLHIFADSCGGQNKNINIIRFLHYLVHTRKQFKSIQVTYPIRGHSYLECDKQMGLINSKFGAELPCDWVDHFREARQNPRPFEVEEVDHTFWHEWSNFLGLTYKKKLTVPTRPIKELKITEEAERLLYYRHNYNGPWYNVVITLPQRKRFCVEKTTLPTASYKGKLPIQQEKYADIIDLSKFCKKKEAVTYFKELPHSDVRNRK
ncbi:uncharacterized protein LOC111049285 [Nilaparvata lugens]|uniref:uncharacterized protein LOC111061015 n=1 Tax=Nilaparvata lugens TaxID=108931 RepID=UPI000B98FFD8|nr:uncharacterized protein LOC111061015 [Nilaparvata lugens]XP_039297600.1 uncharacterized protein LOC111049285 [Nilaparvata lugens]